MNQVNTRLLKTARQINSELPKQPPSSKHLRSAMRRYLHGELLANARIILDHLRHNNMNGVQNVIRLFGPHEPGDISISLPDHSYFMAYSPTEPELTRTLAWFLDSRAGHGLSDRVSRSFISTIRECIHTLDPQFPDAQSINIHHEAIHTFRAYAEHSTKSMVSCDGLPEQDSLARMDIVLTFIDELNPKPIDHVIVIECKFDADLNPEQLYPYEDWLSLLQENHPANRGLILTRLVITRGSRCIDDLENDVRVKNWKHLTWLYLLRTWEKWFPRNTVSCFVYDALQGLRRDLWLEGVVK